MSWSPFPLLRIAFFFIAGILYGIHSNQFLGVDQCVIIVSVACGAFFLLRVSSKMFKVDKSLVGIVGLVVFSVFGFVSVSLRSDLPGNHHLTRSVDYDSYDIRINSFAEEKKTTWKLVGEITSIHTNGEDQFRQGKILLYFSKLEFEQPFAYGDILHVYGRAQRVDGPSNPEVFDYRQFLERQNIFHQHYIRNSDSVQWLCNKPNSIIKNVSISIRTWAHHTLSRFIEGERELAIASALILGVKDGLDNELMQSYATSGAMHVLAVSGLHVGIVYLMLTTVLHGLENRRSGKWIVAVIVISILWMYALVTGMSPSVIRSVTMFTFVALSKPLNRTTNIFNLLAAAAFVMLCYDPYLVMSVGFQLSFIAVAGIVYFHPRLYNLWTPQNELVDRVWQLTSVSLAAQLATFPLGLYYFHQFPVYFLLANLFVIPAAFLILVGGLILLAVSAVSALASIVGYCLSWIIWSLNRLVEFIGELPLSAIRDVVVDTHQCLVVYAIIFSITALLVTKRFYWVTILLALSVSLSYSRWTYFRENVDAEFLTIYDVPKYSVFEFSSSGVSQLYCDSRFLKDSASYNFNIRPNHVAHGINDVQLIVEDSVSVPARILQRNGLKMLIVSSEFYPQNELVVDYLIISNNALKKYLISDRIKATTIILDSSNSYYFAERVMKNVNGNVYSVKHAGAYQVRL